MALDLTSDVGLDIGPDMDGFGPDTGYIRPDREGIGHGMGPGMGDIGPDMGDIGPQGPEGSQTEPHQRQPVILSLVLGVLCLL